MKRLFGLTIFMLMLLSPLAQAQDFTVDPNANISWPPPIYAVSGQFEVRGTANLPNMTNYFIEFRALNDDLTSSETTVWTPATLPSSARVVDDVLGTWNTTILPDGVYEIRMTVGVSSGSPVYVVVSPLRVSNEPPPFAATTVPPTESAPLPTETPLPQVIPTLVATPTVLDNTPRAEIVVGANVRTGDSTSYPVILGLVAGEIVPIVGISTTGSGWYLIELPSGRRGWIAPSVMRATGDTRNLPRVAPPPVPATPTPVPTATPVTQANLVISSLSLSPDPPRCRETFTITARILNNGTGPTNSSGSIQVTDVHAASGTTTASTNGGFPVLNPGQTFDAIMRLTVDTYYEETHRLTVVIDSLSQIPETNEGDNTFVRDYTLRREDC